MSDRLTISVVVCTRDRERELQRCLEGLRHQTYRDYEVLIVDNAPRGSETFEIARRRRVPYVMEPQPGLSRARNAGVRAASGDIVAFLDDDAMPHRDWLRCLAAEFADPDVAVVTGRIRELQTPGESRSEIGDAYSLDCLGEERRPVGRDDPQWFEITNFGGIGQGSNMAFRRTALQSWSGFDHRLGRGSRISGSEEHYAFFSLVEQGHRVVYAPSAEVFHPFPADLRLLRDHELRQLAAATGYMTFLFFEEPAHRRRLIRYALEAFVGTRRPWRQQPPPGRPRAHSRLRNAFALLAGPLLYLRTRLGIQAQSLAAPLLPNRVTRR